MKVHRPIVLSQIDFLDLRKVGSHGCVEIGELAQANLSVLAIGDLPGDGIQSRHDAKVSV